jgi:DNA-binding PadR family transcriptional regulator
MNLEEETLNGLIQELRRGTIVLGVLSQLFDPKYGYSLVQSLEEKGFGMDAGTLYPLLRRLEKQELLVSKWETSGTKPRKYYILTDSGKKVYAALCGEWNGMVRCMETIIMSGGEKHE